MKTILSLALLGFLVPLLEAQEVRTSDTAETILFVRTVPSGARVLSDGQLLGDSDDLFRVEPGTHRIAIDLNGYEPTEQKITVRRGEVTRLTLDLKKRTAGVAATRAPRLDTPTGKDAFYNIPLGDLKITEGKLPELRGLNNQIYTRLVDFREQLQPYGILDGPGEVYCDADAIDGMRSGFDPNVASRGAIVVRAPEGKDVAGRLFVPSLERSFFPGGVVMVRFTVPASAAKPEARELFYRGKLAHYENLLRRDIPGAAWFRHEARLAQLALRQSPTTDTTAGPRISGGRMPDDLSRTYELFSGGRAISENLQLDRALPANPRPDEKPVKIDSIRGVTINEIDWQAKIKGLQPKLDPLASLVPADQHVVFFPTFQAAIRVADEADRYGTPVLRLAEPRSENAMVAERCQRQLCLSMTGVGRLIGPHVARSVALTGSDPFFPMGTDVAVLFETPKPLLLENLLLAQIRVVGSAVKEAKPVDGSVDGIVYHGMRSADRGISSYVARLGDAVVVTNSPAQLGRLASVRKGGSKSIASLPEYVFFRDRYRLGDPEEDALVFLSDATIRRWCGPRWRISDSRRTRDAAVMAELQASQLDRLVRGEAKPGPIYTDLPLVGGELLLTPEGVVSSTLGTLEFMTPIAEMPLDEVAQAEAEAYNRWRDGYQKNWRWAFDPIGLRIGLGRDRLAADLTVMPLILSSEYRRFLPGISTVQGATITAGAGDPHDALLQLVFALNPKSLPVDLADELRARGLTLDWLGSSMSVYADNDPFWEEYVKRDGNVTLQDRLPIGIHAEVSNGRKLTLFLAALRASVDQTAPGDTVWESLTYRGQPYVRVSPGEKYRGRLLTFGLVHYYAASADALVVALNEKVLKRAIDRQLARAKSLAEDKEPSAKAKPWLGSNVALHVDRKALEVLSSSETMQVRAWGNLPILNTWKRMYPDQDPVALHERIWHTQLACPGGGTYVWNEKWQTMESTVYGHFGQPKRGPAVPPALEQLSSGNFGLDFEDQGLRARVSLERKHAEKAADIGSSRDRKLPRP